MTGINHKQAHRYLRAAADGLIRDNQRALLDAHLRDCASCRTEADELNALETRLKKNFQARWDAHDGPSKNVITKIRSQSWRIIMTNRINFGLKTLAGIAVLLVLGLIFSSIIRQVQNSSTNISASTPTATIQQFPSIATDKSNGEWIAFIGGKVVPWPDSTALDITQDIYMIHPDGTGLMKLSNNADHSGYLFHDLQWSPDGENLIILRNDDNNKIIIGRISQYGGDSLTPPIADPDNYGYSWSPNSDKIVFADASSGNYDIYTVYADGRNDPQLTQLTNDSAQDVGFVWSPDGSQMAYQRLDGDKLSVYIMNADGSDQREVALGAGQVNLRWSLDGTSIYASSSDNSWLDCNTCVSQPGIYRIDIDGPVQVHQIHYEQDAGKASGWYLYDTPQDMLYYMRPIPSDSLGMWGTWSYVDGDSVHKIGELDPHQTCKTTTGNILNEHISPNERFSIVSDSCAGGFDLYLADREATTPEKRLTHLLRLPLSTYGQGANNAYLPIRWSPDGRWLSYDDDRGSTYLLDIEKVMQDPATKPSILIQPKFYTIPSGTYPSPENISVIELAWQPRP